MSDADMAVEDVDSIDMSEGNDYGAFQLNIEKNVTVSCLCLS